jgi:hypothetical protein
MTHEVAQHSVHPTLRQAQGPLVGVCAFSGNIRDSKLVPSEWRCLVPPTSGYPVKITRGRPHTVGRLFTGNSQSKFRRLRIEKMMDQTEVEKFVAGMENVQSEENFGYVFFFVGDDHRLPFVTIANSDNDFDNVSNLSREGVFRINIGISKDTFQNLIGQPTSEIVDYSVLNTFLPHPDYAKQHFVCILNPSGENVETTKKLIEEAHAIAAKRLQHKAKK